MSSYQRPKTRLQTESEVLRLLHLPEACLSLIVSYATQGAPWKERCRLAQVCRTFRQLFAAQAFAGQVMRLDLNSLSWRLAEGKRKAARRTELLAAVARYAPSVSHLRLRYQLDRHSGLALHALLAPLAPRVRKLEVDDGLCPALLACFGGQGRKGGGGGGASGAWQWAALQEVHLTGCNLWIDLHTDELAALERQLAALPALTSRVVRFECSCQGMQEGGESFLHLLTALRSLELEDWLSWDVARDYAALRAMPHLTRLGLNIVEDLEANIQPLLSLTQVRELTIQGCYRACRAVTQLTNLVMLDLQEAGMEDQGPDLSAAAAWKVDSLTELRWCGDLVFDDEHPGGPPAIQLPRLMALEIDEAYLPPAGLPPQLCDSLTQLTSLRLVGGRCTHLPPAISKLANLQVLAIDSCELPTIPPAISMLTAVTSLQLSNSMVGPFLPLWVLSLPVRKLWVASNHLTNLLPAKGVGRGNSGPKFQDRKAAWLSRLTHVCLYSNNFREVPPALLEHAAELAELDMSYNHHLQITSKTADRLREVTSLRLLRLEKSYWLRMEDRWTQASLRAIARLQRERPDMQVDYEHKGSGSVRLAW